MEIYSICAKRLGYISCSKPGADPDPVVEPKDLGELNPFIANRKGDNMLLILLLHYHLLLLILVLLLYNLLNYCTVYCLMIH